jgi:streptogramin lyase
MIAGCSSHSNLPAPGNIAPDSVKQQVLPPGWTYTILKRIGGQKVMSVGLVSDTKKVWATVVSSDGLKGALDKIALGGRVTQYPLNVVPYAIAFGPDNNFWLTTTSGVVARVTPAGQETDFTVDPGMYSGSIIGGSDGALWFTECAQDKSGGVGRIDLQGSYTFYPSVCPRVIASGPDGNIWFGDGANIYAMTTQGESIGEYAVGDQVFTGIAVGSDGNLYVAGADPIADFSSVTMAGVVTHIGPDGNLDGMSSISKAADGKLWMSAYKHLVAFDPATQTWTSRVKSPGWGTVLVGPDGNIWKTDIAARVDRYALN